MGADTGAFGIGYHLHDPPGSHSIDVWSPEMNIVTTHWKALGAQMGEGHIFAIGDIHGQADVLDVLLKHMDDLPGEGPRHFVQTGDLIDRGPESLRSCALAMSAKDLCDTHVLLPGNHEIMLLQALRNMSDYGALWTLNGGHSLLEEVDPQAHLNPDDLCQAIRQALPPGFLEIMARSPGHWHREELLFVHAGLHPHLNEVSFLSEPWDSALPAAEHWAWIRDPFLDWTKGWDTSRRRVVVHGHTPATGDFLVRADDVNFALDKVQSHRRICLDACAAAIPQAAMVELTKGRYRIHVATA
jgi:serine/threonine protein phosphatase 1